MVAFVSDAPPQGVWPSEYGFKAKLCFQESGIKFGHLRLLITNKKEKRRRRNFHKPKKFREKNAFNK